MKFKKQYLYIIAVVLAAILAVILFSKTGKKANDNGAVNPTGTKIKPLNITVMLDLSDRLTHKGANDNLSQIEKDSTILMDIQKNFYSRQYNSGRMNPTQDKIQVICHPYPTISNINSMIEDMAVDLSITSGSDIKNNKKELKEMNNIWSSNISSIYRQTIKTGKFLGSDIWGFFNKDAKVQCIRPNHRNILIILTDGYIYHKNNWAKTSDNVYTGIVPKTVNTQKAISPVKTKYNDLEVLFLEINPSPGNTATFNKIDQLITDWCTSMGIQHVEVVQTNLPTQTQKYIDNFIGW